jgi:hypothetical protein
VGAGTDCCDLLKQGALVLGVACCEHPPRVVGQKCGIAIGDQALTPRWVAHVPDGEQGHSDASEAWQVVLTELCEGPVCNPLQSVVEVISRSHGEPSHQARVQGVSRDVHVNLTTPTSKLMVQAAAVGGGSP